MLNSCFQFFRRVRVRLTRSHLIRKHIQFVSLSSYTYLTKGTKRRMSPGVNLTEHATAFWPPSSRSLFRRTHSAPPLRRPIGRTGCALPAESRAGRRQYRRSERVRWECSEWRQRKRSTFPTRLTKIGTLSPEVIASRIGVKGSSRTNVGCAARCHGGLGVSACARILDVGDGTCDHIHAQSSVAVYDTTSGMNMICFFIRIGKA